MTIMSKFQLRHEIDVPDLTAETSANWRVSSLCSNSPQRGSVKFLSMKMAALEAATAAMSAAMAELQQLRLSVEAKHSAEPYCLNVRERLKPLHPFAVADRDALNSDTAASIGSYVRADSAGARQESNRLAAPGESFQPTMRLSSPRPGSRMPSGRRRRRRRDFRR
jgi:hypothetical protein